MAEKLYRTIKSPRHGFEFSEVPTVRGSIYGGSIVFHYPEYYGPILDCVFEMADQISTSNGIGAEAAIDMVLRDEGWRIIPRHRKQIIARLSAD